MPLFSPKVVDWPSGQKWPPGYVGDEALPEEKVETLKNDPMDTVNIDRRMNKAYRIFIEAGQDKKYDETDIIGKWMKENFRLKGLYAERADAQLEFLDELNKRDSNRLEEVLAELTDHLKTTFPDVYDNCNTQEAGLAGELKQIEDLDPLSQREVLEKCRIEKRKKQASNNYFKKQKEQQMNNEQKHKDGIELQRIKNVAAKSKSWFSFGRKNPMSRGGRKTHKPRRNKRKTVRRR
jgi:hypothetical protein